MSWLEELAANIEQALGGGYWTEGTAEEKVEYALSKEGREAWGITLPRWFDKHDRGLLTEMVAGTFGQ